MRLLLVEDDPNLSGSLKADLEYAGFAVDTALDGETGEFLGATENYDIAILDLGLPKLSGLEVLSRWRAANNNLPVIVLTARDAWHEKVDGFKAGADDYLGKPFHIEELLARIGALLKRLHGRHQ
ncbi:MAG: response regulator, partial [Methylobacter sp.]